MIKLRQLLTLIVFLIGNFLYSQVNIFSSGMSNNILQDYEFIFGVGNANITPGNINTDNISSYDVVIINSIDQNYNANIIPKLVTFINNGGHVILATEGGMAGSNQLMSSTWNTLTGESITETASWASGTSTPPRFHNSNGPWLSSPDVNLTGSTTSYASFGNMNSMNVTHQRFLTPPTCDNIEALSAVYPALPNLGDGTLYIQGEVQYPFNNFMGSAELKRHARALVRMHYALLNNDQDLLDSLNSWAPNLAVDSNFLAVQDTAFCDSNFSPFSISAPTKYNSYSWEDTNENVLGTNRNFTINQSGTYIIKTTGVSPVCDGIDTLIVGIDSLVFSSTSVASCANTTDGELLVDNVSAKYLANPINYRLDNIIQTGNNLFENLAPGNYNLVVEDARGCTDSATVTIDSLEVPTPLFSFDEVCLGDPTSFTDASSINTGSITNWEWTIDNTIDNNQNTSYTLPNISDSVQLKITSDDGCIDSITQNVVVNPLPEGIITGNIEVCQDDTEPYVTFIGSNSTAPYTFNYTINGGVQQSVTSVGDTAKVNVSTNTAGTYTYELISIEDSSPTNCSNNQTGDVVITVKPLPTASIDGTADVCQDDTEPQVTFTGENGTAPYTFTYTNPNGNTQTITSDNSGSATINAPTDIEGTFNYDLVSVQDASTSTCSNGQTGTVTITVNPLPTATIDGTTIVCQNDSDPEITFTGSNATSPYIFTYSDPNGDIQTVTSDINGIATINASTNIDGTFTYELVSVEDASSTACSNTQKDSISITVNPLPTATISGTINVCQDDDEPQVTFTGSNGTAPYTFTYNINGDTPQTITTTSGNSVSIDVSTSEAGAFNYNIISVQDNSASNCTNNQTGSVTINVQPTPTATSSTSTDVCQDDSEPEITFTGANGTSNYEFSYTLNGGGLQTITSAGGNSAIIDAPTDIPGTFTYVLLSTEDVATGCSTKQSDTITVHVHPTPQATMIGDATVCEDDNEPIITLEGINSNEDYQFTYNINNGSNQTISTHGGSGQNITVPTDIPGIYDYELTQVKNPATGCFTNMSQTVTVEIEAKPIADFYPDPDQLTSYNWESQMVNESINADNYYWDFGDETDPSSTFSPIHNFPHDKTADYNVMLVASTANGLCVDTTYQIVQFKNELLFYVPNTFTPNGDKYNNTFLPIFTAGFDPNDYTLIIFDRWGEMIFESHNSKIGWDGSYQGKKVQSGTYIWKIIVKKSLTSTREKYVGNVNVLK